MSRLKKISIKKLPSIQAALMFIIIMAVLMMSLRPAEAKLDVPIDTSAIEDAFSGKELLQALDQVLGHSNELNAKIQTGALDTPARTQGSFLYQSVHNGVTQRVFRGLAGIAAALVILTLYIRIIQEAQRGDVTMDFWLRIFITMVLACAIIFNLPAILDGLDTFGYGLIDVIREKMAVDSSRLEALSQGQANDLKNALLAQEAGVIEKVLVNVCLIIMRLLTMIPKTIVYVVAFSTFFELALRRAFAPIAIADMTAEGMRGPGLRFFKRYLAVYVRVGLFYVICILSVQFSIIGMQWGNAELAAKVKAVQKVDKNLTNMFTGANWEGAVREIQEGVRSKLDWESDTFIPPEQYALKDPTYSLTTDVFVDVMNQYAAGNELWDEWRDALKNHRLSGANTRTKVKPDKEMIGEIVAKIDRIDLNQDSEGRESSRDAQIASIRKFVKKKYKAEYDFTALSVLSVMFKILIIVFGVNMSAGILMIKSKQFSQELVGL